MKLSDIVTFQVNDSETAEGIITRVWDKPQKDPYVTIRTDEERPRTFVRCSSVVRPGVTRETVQAMRLDGCTCPRTYSWHFAGCIWSGA